MPFAIFDLNLKSQSGKFTFLLEEYRLPLVFEENKNTKSQLNKATKGIIKNSLNKFIFEEDLKNPYQLNGIKVNKTIKANSDIYGSGIKLRKIVSYLKLVNECYGFTSENDFKKISKYVGCKFNLIKLRGSPRDALKVLILLMLLEGHITEKELLELIKGDKR